MLGKVNQDIEMKDESFKEESNHVDTEMKDEEKAREVESIFSGIKFD